MEYYSATENEILTFATWTDLEGTMLSRRSQKNKHKYHVISPIHGL